MVGALWIGSPSRCDFGGGFFWGEKNPWLLVFCNFWCFPKIGVPQNGWFIIREHPIRMDDLEVPFFLETLKSNPSYISGVGFECKSQCIILKVFEFVIIEI